MRFALLKFLRKTLQGPVEQKIERMPIVCWQRHKSNQKNSD